MSKFKSQPPAVAVSVCLSLVDEEKLDRIRRAFFSDSRSRAGRIALSHWHEHLEIESRRDDFVFTPRPEFKISLSPQSGAKVAKFYLSADDIKRLRRLMRITGESGRGRLIRAAVGWYVEHLNV